MAKSNINQDRNLVIKQDAVVNIKGQGLAQQQSITIKELLEAVHILVTKHVVGIRK